MAALTTTEPAAGSAPPAPKPPRKIGFSQRLSRWDVKVSPYLYISPFFILFAFTGLFPLAYTAVVSLFDWHMIMGAGEFVGFDNYSEILGQAMFWKSLGNTFSIFLLSSVPQVIIAIMLAALLDQNLRNATFWRMGVLVPYVVAPIAVSLIFGRLFADQFGLINELLGVIGVEPIGWHKDRLASHVAIATMVNYRWTGYNTLIFLAAMQAVPRDLYEAATIDGAGQVRQFFSVTIPQIRSTIIFVVITASIGGLQIFDEPKLFERGASGTHGGPNGDWLTTVFYMYDVAWGNQKDLGRASAVAWILFVVILVIGFVNFMFSRSIATSGPKTPKVSRAVTRRMLAEAKAAGEAAAAARAAAAAAGSRTATSTDRGDS